MLPKPKDSASGPDRNGVLQGYVVRPLLFSNYHSPLEEIIEKHNISYHIYADHGKMYLAFSPTDEVSEEEEM